VSNVTSFGVIKVSRQCCAFCLHQYFLLLFHYIHNVVPCIHQVLGEDPVTFPNFRNLRTLLLDNCDLSDNFKTLEHFLKNSPDLEKLTLRCCKFSKDLKKKKAKSKRASSSQCLNLVDVQCKNLKHTEIIYKDDDVRLLVELLLTISANLPKNNIKVTKVH